MRYPLDCQKSFADSLLFWCVRFLRYKLTTLSNRNVKDKEKFASVVGQLQSQVSDINTLEALSKEARNLGLIGIGTYATPIIKLYAYLTKMNFSSLKQIDEECLSDFLLIEGSGLSPTSKKNYRIALMNFFGYLDKQNENQDGQSYIFNIELKNIGGIMGKSGQKLPAYMNEVEINRFICCIDEFQQSENVSVRNRLIIKMILYTGIRVSEALNLRKKDIFPEKETYLLQIRGKGDKMRVVMIKRKHIEQLLQEWMKKRQKLGVKTEFLFCNQKGQPLTQAYIYKVVDEILCYAGIFKEKMGAHMLRHSFATLLYQKSQDLVLVQEALGHADLNTSRIYTHFDKNRLQQAASLMDEMGKKD